MRARHTRAGGPLVLGMHPLVLAMLTLPLVGMLVHLAITTSVARAFARIMARSIARFAVQRSSKEWQLARQVRRVLHGGAHGRTQRPWTRAQGAGRALVAWYPLALRPGRNASLGLAVR